MRRSGENIAIQVADLLAGPYTNLACFTNIDISQARDRFEVTCGGDANKTYVQGKKDFTGTAAFVWDDPNTEIFDAADSPTPKFYRIFPDKVNLPNDRWEGQLFLDLSITMPVGGAITGTLNFAAAGNVAYTTVVIP